MTFLIHERATNRNRRTLMSKIFNANKFCLYSSSIHKLVVRSCYGRLRSTPCGRSHCIPYGRLLSSRNVSCSIPGW
ncbi:MAG: hypothetical protein KGR70_17085 [Cyanobacteria bacterium REEB494]|nr:hypothetical protein [Cyanobacteria bacterium REEB494]